jgi:hypothetical protein
VKELKYGAPEGVSSRKLEKNYLIRDFMDFTHIIVIRSRRVR